MTRRCFVLAMIVIGLVFATMSVALPREHLYWVAKSNTFFDNLMPILVVTALLNYLWKSARSCNCSFCRGESGSGSCCESNKSSCCDSSKR